LEGRLISVGGTVIESLPDATFTFQTGDGVEILDLSGKMKKTY